MDVSDDKENLHPDLGNAMFSNGTKFYRKDGMVNHAMDELDDLAQVRDGRRSGGGEGRERHAAAGDAEQAEQQLALQDVHAHRRGDVQVRLRLANKPVGTSRRTCSASGSGGDSISLKASRTTRTD